MQSIYARPFNFSRIFPLPHMDIEIGRQWWTLQTITPGIPGNGFLEISQYDDFLGFFVVKAVHLNFLEISAKIKLRRGKKKIINVPQPKLK